ncbi:MAG: hypothetical protein M5U05_16750 [Anaerolineales bacterium]|jgi:menaquinone-dependent protoporphyrinogen oxidase|nr:hypothetical protein [Anaerolineales bacterium]
MSKKITNRQFLAYLAADIGATTLTCARVSPITLRRPVDSQFRKLTANRNLANPVVLVTYATRAGSTMEIAHRIATELEERDFAVNICPIKRVTSLVGYSHVVIGSAIRMGSPLPEITHFVEEYHSELRGIPLACFAVYLQHDGQDETSRKARLAYLNPIRNLLSLQYEAFFTGVYDPTKVPSIDAVIGNIAKTPVGDFRDWAAIKDWGQSIFSVSLTAWKEREAVLL